MTRPAPTCDLPGLGLAVAPDQVPDPARDIPTTDDRGEAILAGGCFWCTEAVFRRLRGVSEVVPGYAGGAAAAPATPKSSACTTTPRRSAMGRC
jgi:hypothetical protein